MIFGFGNVVQYVVEKVMYLGVKVVLLFDFVGMVYVKVGFIDVLFVEVMELKNVKCGCIFEFVFKYGFEYLEGQCLWFILCDIVLLCVI